MFFNQLIPIKIHLNFRLVSPHNLKSKFLSAFSHLASDDDADAEESEEEEEESEGQSKSTNCGSLDNLIYVD